MITNALVLYYRRHTPILDLDPDDFFKGQGSPGEFSVPGIFPLQVSCPGTDTALFFIKSELTHSERNIIADQLKSNVIVLQSMSQS